MSEETFTSGRDTHKITMYPPPVDGKKHAMVLVLHGNAGLNPPFASQIHRFAQSLAELGYVAVVPLYYHDNLPHLLDGDPRPHVGVLTDAIAKVAARGDVDPGQLGLVGYSLGAATAMTYIASSAAGKVKVLVDFFGPIQNNPIIASGVAKFPPTIIFHNERDMIVEFIANSRALNEMLPKPVEHRLVTNKEDFPLAGFHPFKENGPADVDSRKQATEWILRHLPPTR